MNNTVLLVILDHKQTKIVVKPIDSIALLENQNNQSFLHHVLISVYFIKGRVIKNRRNNLLTLNLITQRILGIQCNRLQYET